MSDWPQTIIPPLHLGTISLDGPAPDSFPLISPAVSTFAWPAQNLAIFMPVAVRMPYPVRRVWWVAGAGAGNYDFGIYSLDGARIYHTGSTAIGTSEKPQYVTPSTPFLLSPGHYYFALANDSATTTNRGYGCTATAANDGRLAGMLQQASAFPLPEVATLAAWASTGMPSCGVTRTDSGF